MSSPDTRSWVDPDADPGSGLPPVPLTPPGWPSSPRLGRVAERGRAEMCPLPGGGGSFHDSHRCFAGTNTFWF